MTDERQERVAKLLGSFVYEAPGRMRGLGPHHLAALTEYLIEHRSEVLAALDEEVQDLALCESRHLIFKPNLLYRFNVIPGCKACAALEAVFVVREVLER